MKNHYEELDIRTKGELDVRDITGDVEGAVKRSNMRNGLACVSCIGSTAAITTLEYESGLVRDIKDALERMMPKGIPYEHEERWRDGNGHSHIRASFMGPSVTIPVREGDLVLGTWQQLVFIELDTRGRDRRVAVQLIGE